MDDEFEPKLGRMRTAGSKRGRKYLHRVLAASALAGGSRRLGRGRFNGSRIGRGAAMGRLLGSRDRLAGLRARRAIVKTRLVRLGGKGAGGALAHLRYIQRDGVQRDGSPGMLYSAHEDSADGKAFLERCDEDRHQFRFIVSAEDGAEYDDLRPLVRRWMARMEEDLGTSLDWVAADHCDTGHPHTHVMLRGKDDKDENLVIAREYIARGMRERLAEIITLDLGPRTQLEIARKLRLEMTAERLTSIDRMLVRDGGLGGVVAAGHRDAFQHAVRAGRLKKLEALGLAQDLGGGKWKLDGRLEEKLRAMGERGDIVRTMQRALRERGLQRPLGDQVAHNSVLPGRPLVGQVVARGLSDELADRHYLIVDGIDGRIHHLDIGHGEGVEALPEGSIVRLSSVPREARQADRTVAEIAVAYGGRYSAEIHRLHDPSVTEAFAQAHVRRLEALRRESGAVERREDGSWTIAPDHLERAAAFEERTARRQPIRVETLSTLPLERLKDRDGATWLDRELASDHPEPLRDAGFGREVRTALALRRAWLLQQDLATEEGGQFVLRPNSLGLLERRELLRAAAEFGRDAGKEFVEPAEGARLAGIVRRRVDLASGRFALVESGHEFSLVPWRPVLERALGKQISGIFRESGTSWTIGRVRGLEI